MLNKPTQDKWLDQKGNETAVIQIPLDHDYGQFCSDCSLHLGRSSVDSTHLKYAQNRERDNQRSALIGGRYNEQATKPYASSGAIASEAKADGGTAVWRIVSESDERKESAQGKARAGPCERGLEQAPLA